MSTLLYNARLQRHNPTQTCLSIHYRYEYRHKHNFYGPSITHSYHNRPTIASLDTVFFHYFC